MAQLRCGVHPLMKSPINEAQGCVGCDGAAMCTAGHMLTCSGLAEHRSEALSREAPQWAFQTEEGQRDLLRLVCSMQGEDVSEYVRGTRGLAATSPAPDGDALDLREAEWGRLF